MRHLSGIPNIFTLLPRIDRPKHQEWGPRCFFILAPQNLEEHLISRVHEEDHLGNTNPDTAHQTSQDTWFQVGFLLTTAANSAYVLGYSAAIMVPLGWVAGVLGFIAAPALSLYANCLIAKLHRFGGKRHIRYRDLAGHIYGSNAYRLTWALQYANFTLINIGYIIVAGQALKDAYILLWDNHTMKLPHFIAIAGFVCATFAISIPHLSALRVWLGFSTIFTLVYIIIAVVLSLTNGIKAPARNYSIPGSEASKVFRAISATADLFFAFSTGMLPEIQATMRQPAVENMRKALFLQLTVGVLPMYAVVFVGYWAFGNSASSYLLSSISGPVWLKTAANLAAFFQSRYKHVSGSFITIPGGLHESDRGLMHNPSNIYIGKPHVHDGQGEQADFPAEIMALAQHRLLQSPVCCSSSCKCETYCRRFQDLPCLWRFMMRLQINSCSVAMPVELSF